MENTIKIDNKTYEELRRARSRRLSKRLFPFYKVLANFLKGSDDFWILDLKSKSPDLFLIAKNNTSFSYEQIQTEGNVRNLDRTSEAALLPAIQKIVAYLQNNKQSTPTSGICHGVRDGTEVLLFKRLLVEHFSMNSVDVIGTDISHTATRFQNIIQQDFHVVTSDQIEKFDFVYSNSLDQSNDPQKALLSWLRSLKPDGMIFVDLGRAGKSGWATLDPFCCEPEFFPMVALRFLNGTGAVTDIIEKVEGDSRNLIFVIEKRLLSKEALNLGKTTAKY